MGAVVNRYRVAFKGEVVAGCPVHEVKAAFAARFRKDADAIERIFSGDVKTLAKDLDFPKANAIANSLKENNIRVFTIHIGRGSPPPEVAVIASITGGQVFAAGDPKALEAVFESIDGMQQAELVRLTPDPVDFFQPFAIAGLSLGGLWLLTLFGFRYNPW